jgi:hypothetical protein
MNGDERQLISFVLREQRSNLLLITNDNGGDLVPLGGSHHPLDHY